MLQRSRPDSVIGLEALVHVVSELLSVRIAEALEGHRPPRRGIGRDGRQTRESPCFRHPIPGDALVRVALHIDRGCLRSPKTHGSTVGPIR
jgi:hypothetical protein